MSNGLKYRADSTRYALSRLHQELEALLRAEPTSELLLEHALQSLGERCTAVARALDSFEDQRVRTAFDAIQPAISAAVGPGGLAGTTGWRPEQFVAEYRLRLVPRIRFLSDILANFAIYTSYPNAPLFPGTDHIQMFNNNVRAATLKSTPQQEKKLTQRNPQSVFIVHGRNLNSVRELKKFLHFLGLQVKSFEEAAAEAGPNAVVREVVKNAVTNSGAVLVLFTPDEKAKLVESLGTEVERLQARPNVLYEAGLAMGLNASTIFVSVGNVDVPSDLHGTHFVRLSNDNNIRHSLYLKLKAAGCQVPEPKADLYEIRVSGDFSVT